MDSTAVASIGSGAHPNGHNEPKHAESLEDVQYETRLFINGKYVKSKSPERLTIYNPVDDSIISDDVHVAGEEDIDEAVRAARKAFPAWSQTPAKQRAAILHKFADVILAHKDQLARIEANEQGLPISVFIDGIMPMIIDCFRYYAGWCDKLAGEFFPPTDGGFARIVRREAIGVCAAINAFNGPLTMFALKVAPALATGNVSIVKASEKVPLTTLYLGNLANEAGIPPGVLQLVSGSGATGALLASHMDIDKISFTGSTATGRRITKAAVESNMKRVTLELGGKSPSIVFPDANMDVAVEWCVRGITINSGQACIASSRVYVHESIKDEFISRMKQAFEAIPDHYGDPTKSSTTFPPLADKMQFKRVSEYIASGKTEATLITGGEPAFTQGCYMKPAIFVDATPSARIYKEEIFGPVVVISTFADEEEVLTRANDTRFGLAGAVFTQDINRAMRVSGAIQSGTVCINCCMMVDVAVPFGGMKESGWGRELGKYGLDAYTDLKTVFVNMTY